MSSPQPRRRRAPRMTSWTLVTLVLLIILAAIRPEQLQVVAYKLVLVTLGAIVDYGGAVMSDVSEETKREVMKLAVQLTTTYVEHRNPVLDNRGRHWLGIEERKTPPRLPDIIEGIYRQLLDVMGK
ncbi:TPA: putative holin [Pseudomonas aeruginosa]